MAMGSRRPLSLAGHYLRPAQGKRSRCSGPSTPVAGRAPVAPGEGEGDVTAQRFLVVCARGMVLASFELSSVTKGAPLTAQNFAPPVEVESRSEEPTSELRSLIRLSFAVSLLKTKIHNPHHKY